MARLLALGIPAPGRYRVWVTLAGLAFTTTVRVIHRIHGETAHGGPNAAPAHGSCFTVAAQVVLVITHFADCGAAIDVHLARLTRLQAQIRINTFACGVLHRAAGAARQLTALAWLDFNVVHGRA